VSDRSVEQGRGLTDAVEASRSSVRLNRKFTATCSRTRARAPFETYVLQEAAREHFGQDVVRIIHFGTCACRNVNHRASGRRSEHTTANAIDIAGFILADGQRVTVRSDWPGANEPRSALVHALRA